MHYTIGRSLINEAGIKCKITRECVKCQTLTGDKDHGRYKCCVRSSCPGWTMPVRARSRDYLVVCTRETGGDPEILKLGSQSICELAKRIGQDSIAIFKGDLVKNFNSKIDLTKI